MTTPTGPASEPPPEPATGPARVHEPVPSTR